MRLTIAFALMAIFALPAFADEATENGAKKEAKEKKDKKDKDKKEKEEKKGAEKEKKDAPKYKKAPAFKAKGTDGKEYSLKQFEGKIVVLEWGDHKCPWVKRHYSQGTLQALQKKYTAEDKGVVWLVIASTDPKHRAYLSPEAINAKNDEYKACPTATLMDSNGSIGRSYKAKTTPHMFVIDKKGEIVYSGAPDNLLETKNKDDLKSNESYIAEVLDALLAGKTPETKSNEPYG